MPEFITISPESQGERLDKFLTVQFPQMSRSQIQKAIKNGMILVNKKSVPVHCFLKTNDKIEISLEKETVKITESGKKSLSALAIKKAQKLFSKIKIIEDAADFLIIEKPAGLLVHPTATSQVATLADWLTEQYPELKKIGENPERPAIVHRLDKDVSGLMIIPKNQTSFDYFKKQFQQHTVIKKYLCLVEGNVIQDEGDIKFPITRSKTKPGMFAAHPINVGGKMALTKFIVIKRFKNFTLLEIQILTGRTHQIRVHMLAFSHPVVGDKLYHPQLKPKNDPGRIFLHAAELSFIGPDGKKYDYKSKLPAALNTYLKSIRP